ncbi:amidohydrolase [Cryptosporangium japonicum]|uniref:Amidohydrolase family protein n=1 Tax=Cryptosporangium japonicum TaxID=80872 RepID=A0ABN0U5R4_9ACTN
MSVVLRGGRLGLGGRASDVRIENGTVTAVGPSGSLDAAEVVSLGDATVLPGLVDGHVHVEQWVRHRRSVDLSAVAGPAEAARVLRAQAPPAGQWLSGRDIVPALWSDPPHKRFLDDALRDVPVVVRSIDLHTTWFNSAGLSLVGLAGHPTGVLRETESIEANHRLSELTPAAEVDGWIAEALAELPSLGLTGLIDLEFSDNLAAWRRRATPPVRVHAGIWTPWLDAAIAEGRRTGDVVADRVRVGPYKIVSDGSLNTRTAWCADPYPDESFGLCLVPADQLETLMRKAWAAGLVPAIHAIGDRANTSVLDVFERIGCTGRIEHAQLVSLSDVPRFASLGVVASVQPQHAVTDRDVADRLWAGRTDRAFAYRTLHDAGARLELGSDAPVSPLDPWQAVADAVHRSDDGRPAWHPEQALPLDVAITAACAGRASVEVGAVADLTVVAGDLRSASEEALRSTTVLATLVGGDVTYQR